MISIDEIRNNYKEYSDFEIEKIAINESKSLRKEVLKVLTEEIEKRKLDESLITWVKVENDTLSKSEQESLIRKIEKLPCPNCGERNNTIGGFEFKRVLSILIFYSSFIENRIMCFDCGKRKKRNSILIILLSGWWSIKGLLFTPFTLINEILSISSLDEKSSEILNSFLEKNTGLIRLHGDKSENLIGLIDLHNNDYEIIETEIIEDEQ
ncbi:hypothetical protein [Psychroserpens ponticola]|uniref:Uncharacterized protein n=1 Tax=Psychroserpens ponticola TaxID=2932268 RepID=A0ABY7S565_9FLAO|nr:hypothetical protein [Psychroserpens ponticola]WCO03556.1 hypothetical protein MUN68_008615 [Psychroserpens ponticola]